MDMKNIKVKMTYPMQKDIHLLLVQKMNKQEKKTKKHLMIKIIYMEIKFK